jgi:hypothetical protein
VKDVVDPVYKGRKPKGGGSRGRGKPAKFQHKITPGVRDTGSEVGGGDIDLSSLDNEISKRNTLARLRLEGRDAEVARLEIMANPDLTGLEKEIELRRLANQTTDDQAQTQKEAQAEMVGIAQAGGQAVGQLADTFIDSEGAKAAIKALMAAGESALLFATGNFAGGISAATAATTFTAAAMMGGKGGGSGGGGGGKTGAGSADIAKQQKGGTGFSADPEAGGITGSNMRRVGGGRAMAPIVVNFRSLTRPSPEEARQVADALSDEMRTRA